MQLVGGTREQTAEPIPPVHTVPIPADDGRIGRLQMKRSVGAVGVVVRNVDPQDLGQWRRLTISS